MTINIIDAKYKAGDRVVVSSKHWLLDGKKATVVNYDFYYGLIMVKVQVDDEENFNYVQERYLNPAK